ARANEAESLPSYAMLDTELREACLARGSVVNTRNEAFTACQTFKTRVAPLDVCALREISLQMNHPFLAAAAIVALEAPNPPAACSAATYAVAFGVGKTEPFVRELLLEDLRRVLEHQTAWETVIPLVRLPQQATPGLKEVVWLLSDKDLLRLVNAVSSETCLP